ncbi:hypothetical protein B0H19DRAFT_955935, partial [Mycena capillaripes]
LLHIAQDIRNMGPMWCFWAFVMEHFCGSLVPAVKSRKRPFSSLHWLRISLFSPIFSLKNVTYFSDIFPLKKMMINSKHFQHFFVYYLESFILNQKVPIFLKRFHLLFQ